MEDLFAMGLDGKGIMSLDGIAEEGPEATALDGRGVMNLDPDAQGATTGVYSV